MSGDQSVGTVANAFQTIGSVPRADCARNTVADYGAGDAAQIDRAANGVAGECEGVKVLVRYIGAIHRYRVGKI
jgi:hypothetical protein